MMLLKYKLFKIKTPRKVFQNYMKTLIKLHVNKYKK